MPAYKDQHWLPSAYLKYFSVNQQDCTRKSLIWRLDGKSERCVPVDSQCFANYFYSKENPAEAEQMFQINESAYCDCIDRIRARGEMVGRNAGDLLLAMFDFHLRNAAHKNHIGKEGIETYARRVGIFIGQILLGREDEAITTSDVKKHIENYWGIRIISAPSNHQFVTSDHPSVWRTLGQVSVGLKTKLHLIALPNGSSPAGTAEFFRPFGTFDFLETKNPALKCWAIFVMSLLTELNGILIFLLQRCRTYGAWLQNQPRNTRNTRTKFIFTTDKHK